MPQVPQPCGRFAHFELVSCKCVDTYVRVKKNQNQVCWKLRKVRATSSWSWAALSCTYLAFLVNLIRLLVGASSCLFGRGHAIEAPIMTLRYNWRRFAKRHVFMHAQHRQQST